MMEDLTGMQFGNLTAQWPAGIKGKRICWLFLCSCGKLKVAFATNVKSGKTMSCGCISEYLQIKHGHSRIGKRSREYSTWLSMIQRCTNPLNPAFDIYGGRGISVCPKWRDFRSFLVDMGPRPKGTSIDRYPNTSGNYEPGNCRWATSSQQNSNRRPYHK